MALCAQYLATLPSGPMVAVSFDGYSDCSECSFGSDVGKDKALDVVVEDFEDCESGDDFDVDKCGATKQALRKARAAEEASTTAVSSDDSANIPTASSDSEDDVWCGRDIYSLTFLLQCRSGLRAQGKLQKSPLGYGMKAISELPAQPVALSLPRREQHKLQQPRSPTASKSSDDERLARGIRAVLQELTTENARESVYEKLIQKSVKTPQQFGMLVHEIFGRAEQHQNVISMCVDYCVRFQNDDRIYCAIGPDGGPQSFRQIVLDQIFPAFERILHCNIQKDGRSPNGIVKVLAELICRGLVSPRLLIECAEGLLRESNKKQYLLEPLASLLLATGSRFDGDASWVHAARLRAVFKRIHQHSQDCDLPANIRFVLRDLIHLREAGWVREQMNRGSGSLSTRQITSDEVTNKPSMLSIGRELLSSENGMNEGKMWSKCGQINSSHTSLKKMLRPDPKQQNQGRNNSGYGTNSWNIRRPSNEVSTDFNQAVFQREMCDILKQLGSDANVGAAVKRIQEFNVPPKHQKKEFTDLLTRACETSRQSSRRSAFTVAAGLAADRSTVFERAECIAGISTFFNEVYNDLCEEVPQLPMIVRTEMLPALRSALHYSTVDRLLPPNMR